MVFTSLQFIFFFLPVVLALYYVVPSRWRNATLALSSVVFYTWGGGAFVLILLTSIAVDYAAGHIVSAGVRQSQPRRRNLGIALSVTVNLALLGYFKYADFIIDQLNDVADAFGLGVVAWDSVALPIGISFFTFQSMSYTIDVARGRVEHLRNPVDFALYVGLFPQLIAGPIVRFHEIAGQIRERSTNVNLFAEGVVRFSHGLIKKVVVADAVGQVADAAFGLPGADLTWAGAWIGVIAYTLQIYFDFSGYSDMAIGLGCMFGFTIPENFRRPYSAVSVTDFWRRWHITLSNWFRDYLYVPLGGSRRTSAITYRNLVAVFLLTGLWHGASWTFVVWGAYHGALLIVERVSGQRPVGDGPVAAAAIRRGLVLLAVMLGWVLFRADTFSQAAEFFRRMFSMPGTAYAYELSTALTNRNTLILLLAVATFFLPRGLVVGRVAAHGRGPWPAAVRGTLIWVGLPYAAILIAAGTFSPFLYFRF